MGGEQIYGPEDYRITAASKCGHTEIANSMGLPSADRLLTSGRPLSCGKKRVSAPQEQPG